MEKSRGSWANLRELLYGNWDRVATNLSLLLSATSLLVTVYLVKAPQDVPRFITVRDVLVVSVLFLIIGVLAAKNFRRDLIIRDQLSRIERQRRQLAEMGGYLSGAFTRFYRIIRDFNEELYRHLYPIIPSDWEFQLIEKQRELFHHICRSLTAEVRDAFIEYFKTQQIDVGNDIAVTVKLIIQSKDVVNLIERDEERNRAAQKDYWVLTVYRDPVTYREHKYDREVVNRLYDIAENTDFDIIVNHRQVHFLSNDLSSYDGYRNENPEWSNHYNSTLVVPLKYEDPRSGRRKYFGFLSVDSMNKDNRPLYDETGCVNILGHAAAVLTNFVLAAPLYRAFEAMNQTAMKVDRQQG